MNSGASATSTGSIAGNIAHGVNLCSLFFASGASAVAYGFTLYFDGDPQKGFVLRIKPYGQSVISNGFCFAFAKAENIINGREAVVWKYGWALEGTSNLAGYINGIDLDESGNMLKESFSTTSAAYFPILRTSAAHKSSNPGKFPLVPLIIGPWKMKNMYYYMHNFDLPNVASTSTEMQTVVEIGGRRFIATCRNYTYIFNTNLNLGLLEV